MDVCTVRAIDVRTCWVEANQLVGGLAMVCAWRTASAAAFLTIAIDETNAGCLGATIAKLLHVLAPVPNA
jgi:hypothetical protein